MDNEGYRKLGQMVDYSLQINSSDRSILLQGPNSIPHF